jgi:hypothetical protein
MTSKVMIHEIPTLIKTLLCQLLDEESAWKELAEKMGYINTNSTKYHSLLVSLFVPAAPFIRKWQEFLYQR